RPAPSGRGDADRVDSRRAPGHGAHLITRRGGHPMKCPKCDYLGFETGDRCKNCGYDFSLTTDSTPADRDLPLRESEPLHRDPDRWLNQLEARLDTVRPVAASSAASDPLGSMSLD